MNFNKFFNSFKSMSKEMYIALCMTSQLYAGLILSETYFFRFSGVSGPSMLPTLEARDNLVMVDLFTVRFLRNPYKGEVVMVRNPYKPGYTMIKRVVG